MAAEDWGLCRTPSFQFIEESSYNHEFLEIESQFMSGTETELFEFSGQVRIQGPGQNIEADHALYDNLNQYFVADGNVMLEDRNYRLEMESLNLDQRNQTALFSEVDFQLSVSHASGGASEVEKIDEARSRYQNILYTTCDPEDRDWHFTASEVLIDDDSGRGTARGAAMYFKDVPFFYLPYFMFPIDDRRLTGVLTPTIGSSESHGFTLAVPFYWNIAPHLDATITPVWYKKRGMQINTENRYLYSNHAGQLDLSYLQDDLLDSNRWLGKWQHQADLGLNIEADVLLQEVSDDLYFNDFYFLTTESKTIKNLERHITFRHDSSAWQSNLTWQDYQTLDPTLTIAELPYSRLPRLTVDSQFQPSAHDVQLGLDNELVQFDRDSSVTGTRLNMVPSIAWTGSDSWYYFKPRLQYDLTAYQLEDNNPNDNTINRYLPTASLDSGLVFERLASDKRGWIQTLEPRLFYLYTPFEDQSAIPDFDTADLSETLNNLYSYNRFSGSDRIGDANQITLGLTSRMYSRNSGEEIMNLSLGQIQYLEDRRVSLDGTIDTSTKSDIIAQFSLVPDPAWNLTAKLIQRQEDRELSEKNLAVNYAWQGFAANFGYYFTDQELEQVSVSMAYPVNTQWTVVAKYHQSLLFDEPVENLLGLAYESCCWGIKILASETNDADFLITDRAIYLEFTFKGLSSAGQDVESRLNRSIPGYQAPF
jgi:LPS-assembly protein